MLKQDARIVFKVCTIEYKKQEPDAGCAFCITYKSELTLHESTCFHDSKLKSCSTGSTTVKNLLCPADRLPEGGLRRGYITTRVLGVICFESHLLKCKVKMCHNIGLRPRRSVFGPGSSGGRRTED